MFLLQMSSLSARDWLMAKSRMIAESSSLKCRTVSCTSLFMLCARIRIKKADWTNVKNKNLTTCIVSSLSTLKEIRSWYAVQLILVVSSHLNAISCVSCISIYLQEQTVPTVICFAFILLNPWQIRSVLLLTDITTHSMEILNYPSQSSVLLQLAAISIYVLI